MSDTADTNEDDDDYESNDSSRDHKRCTRGETCICWHILFTLVALAVLGLAIILHVFSQRHREIEAQDRPSLRSMESVPPPPPVGLVRAGGRRVCAGAAVSAWWSLAPGHCVQAHSDPDLADIAHLWTVTYVVFGKQMETSVSRSMVHPRFNRDTFSHDLGLLQHLESLPVDEYRPWLTLRLEALYPIEAMLLAPAETRRANRAPRMLQTLTRATCNELLASATMADHEWCVATRLEPHDCVELGSLVVAESGHCGVATRGEACGGENGRPTLLVITDVTTHAEWMQSIIEPKYNMFLVMDDSH